MSLIVTPETTTPLYQTRTTCRVCGGGFDPLLDLGTPILSGFPLPTEADPPAAPLAAVICQGCGLVQLRDSVDPQRLYGGEYWYRSGINETMVAELADVVRTVRLHTDLTPHDTVLDIGANDGTLLQHYRDAAPGPVPQLFAIEPSASLQQRLLDRAFQAVICTFFPSTATQGLPSGSLAAITTIACFYDLEDPITAVREIARLLRPGGVWVLQFQDLKQMVEAGAWDNVCHEHLTYYSLQTFLRLLVEADVDLGIVAVTRRAINGGSLRIVLRKGAPQLADAAAVSCLDEERTWLTLRRLHHFAWAARQHADQLQATVAFAADQGPVDLYAASTKANTLLQYAGIDWRFIRQAVERTPEKVGRVTAGTRIPIVSEEMWRADPAPLTVLGAWQFKDAFLRREAEYLRRGGTFLAPLPQVEVIRAARVE